MKIELFKEWGLLYRPVTLVSWTTTLLAIAFCVHIFLFVDSRSHSVTDTLYGIFPYVVPTVLALYLFALRTSRFSGRGGS